MRGRGVLFVAAAGVVLATALTPAQEYAPAPDAGKALVESPPLPTAPAKFADAQALADYVDLVLESGWKAQGLAPPRPVDDATWLRRASLDLRGEVASAEEIARFVSDPSPAKRGATIDAFLADRRFAAQMASRWTKLLLVSAGMNSTRLVPYLRPWLEEQFAARKPFASIVRELLTDTCNGSDVDGCGLMLAYFDSVESLTAITARSFLGLQIQCAQCHDHPFDHWKQTDFNRFAGFFAEVRADFAPLRDSEARDQAEAAVGRRLERRYANKHGDGAMEGDAPPMGGGVGDAMGGAAAGEEYSELEESVIDCGFIVEDLPAERALAKRLRKLENKAQAGADKERTARRHPKRAAMEEGATGDDDADGADEGGEPDDDADGGMDADAGRPMVERPDVAELQELTRLLAQAGRAGDKASAQVAKQRDRIDRLTASLAPDARTLVEKYWEHRESFAVAGFPDGSDFTPRRNVSRRAALAEWVVAPGNPWFGASIANRVVAQLLGKGLIEPVDDLSGGIDRIHPDLLPVLGRAFLDHGSDLRFLFAALARTRAYALGAATTADAYEAGRAERWYAAHPARAMTLDQFARSLLKATDPAFSSDLGDEAAARDGWRMRKLVKELMNSCAAPDGTGLTWWSATIPQALFAMNSAFSTAPTVVGDGDALGFAAFADSGRPPVERLSPLWLRTIGRLPTEAEAKRLFELLPAGDAALQDAFGELRWALLNSTEFQVNH